MKAINQLKLISAIGKELARQLGKGLVLNTRQMNSLIGAADLVIMEVERPHVPAAIGMGLSAWLRSDDVGTSSTFMAGFLGGEASPAFVMAQGNNPLPTGRRRPWAVHRACLRRPLPA